MHLVISCSNKPQSLSRVLAVQAFDEMCRLNEPVDLIDLQDYASSFTSENDGQGEMIELASRISAADSVLLSTPIYHFGICSTTRHLIETTTKSWRSKVVGFLCAAAERRNYMAILALSNSLLLEYRCLIVPDIVFTTPKSFEGQVIQDKHVLERIEDLAVNTCQWAAAAAAIRQSRQIRRSH